MPESPRYGVLLVNLGTPDDPSIQAVRRFLAEFLSDRRVIDYPRLLWLPILYGFILRVRPPKTAHAYQQIWTKDGSPLLIETTALGRALQKSLGDDARVAVGMTYGSPSIAGALDDYRRQGINRLVIIPLYPQYSTTTTAPVVDRIGVQIKKWDASPTINIVEYYHDEPRYLDLLAQSVKDCWSRHGRKHLLFSFHGIPQRYVNNGDPYYQHCVATARGTVARLELRETEWSFAFQSRVGKEKWVEPYTDKLLAEYAQKGVRDLSVICPAFATDNLETLEEIAIRNRSEFLAAGGSTFDYIPCLNSKPAHVELFAALVRRFISVPVAVSL